MRSLSIIALIIAAIAFSISISVGYLHLYNVKQISELKKPISSLQNHGMLKAKTSMHITAIQTPPKQRKINGPGTTMLLV